MYGNLGPSSCLSYTYHPWIKHKSFNQDFFTVLIHCNLRQLKNILPSKNIDTIAVCYTDIIRCSLFTVGNDLFFYSRCPTLPWLQPPFLVPREPSHSQLTCYAQDNIFKLIFCFWFITVLAGCNTVLLCLGTLEAFSWDSVRSQATLAVKLAR